MQEVNPNLKYGLLTDSWMKEPWLCKKIKFYFYHPSDGMTQELVEEPHANAGVGGQTAWFGSEKWFWKVINMGVDAIITDYSYEIEAINTRWKNRSLSK